MNCASFENLLDSYIGGRLDGVRMKGAEEHLRVCPRCRRLLETAYGRIDPLPPDMSEDFTRSILERTSGGSCSRALDRFCAMLDDGNTDSDTAALVFEHLGRCPECRSVAGVLREVHDALPGMAEIDPGPEFTQEVLKATTAEPARRGARWAEFWHRLMRRPRFEWEAAYVGALLVLLAFGNPAASVKAAWNRVEGAPAGAWRSAVELVPEDWRKPEVKAIMVAGLLSSEVSTREDDLRQSLAEIRRQGGMLLRKAPALEWKDALQEKAGSFLVEIRAKYLKPPPSR